MDLHEREEDTTLSSLSLGPLSLNDRGSINISSANESSSAFLRKSALQDTSTEFASSPLAQDNVTRNSAIAAVKPQTRKTNDLSELTINKLSISDLGMHGREKEAQILQGAFNSACEGSTKRHFIAISGQSGTGKTKLAESLQASSEGAGGLYARGKFDLKRRNQPFSAISSAGAEICGAILRTGIEDPVTEAKVIGTIKHELGSELKLLTQLIPALDEILEEGPQDQSIQESSASSSLASKDQFSFAFLRFMRILSRHFSAVTMVLDDLQWADASSLDLLEALLMDQKNSELIVIGLYRSNEVDETHIFHRALQDLTAHAAQESFHMSTIDIGNLDLVAVQSIVQKLLSMDDESKTLSLSELCLRKTQGNVFFLLQYLSMLNEFKLLHYNFGTFSWKWDTKEIEDSTSVSDNVLDILKGKMTDLDDELLFVLKVAACIGSTLELRMVELAIQGMASDGVTKIHSSDLPKLTEQLVSGGYIVKLLGVGSSTYCWEHDKIHEAALSMIPAETRTSFAYRIGEILLNELSAKELESNTIFVVANLLNSMDGTSLPQAKRLQLAHLNDQASRKAMQLSAFESSLEYAKKGGSYLSPDSWKKEYDLTLSLYSTGAKAASCVGNYDDLERLCSIVISREDIQLTHKFDVYNAWLNYYMNRGCMPEGRDLILDLLAKFGIKFSRNPLSIGIGVLRNVVKIKSDMHNLEISKLKKADDSLTFETMQLLDKLISCTYQIGDDRLPLVVFRGLKMSTEIGYCAVSPVFFAVTGLMFTGALNDLQSGRNFGDKALELLELEGSKATKVRTYFVLYVFVFPWTKSNRSMLKPMLEGYDVGLQTGDTETACFLSYSWLWMRLLLGYDLEGFDIHCASYGKQMRDLKRHQALFPTLLMRQVSLNLIGKDNQDQPSLPIGKAFTKEDKEFFSDHVGFSLIFRGIRMVLLTFVGEHVECADLCIKYGFDDWAKVNLAYFGHMWLIFLRGISCFAAYQETGKRKYLRVGKAILKLEKGWLKKGNPNIQHYVSFLEGEAMAAKGRMASAIKNFEATIVQAARGGHLHDAGLANERLAHLYRDRLKDAEEAKYRFDEAAKYYTSWGALGKVQLLNLSSGSNESNAHTQDMMTTSSASALTGAF